MRIIISIFFCILLAFNAESQTVKPKVTKSETFKKLGYCRDMLSIGRNEYLGYFVQAYGFTGTINPKYNLVKLDKSLNPVKTVRFEPIIKDKPFNVERIFSIGSDIYTLLSYYNRKAKKTYLFLAQVDRNDLTVTGDIKKVGDIKKASKNEKLGGFEFILSENNKYCAIIIKDPVKIVKTKRKKGSSQTKETPTKNLTFLVVDRSLNLVNSGKKVPVGNSGSKSMGLLSVNLDNKGNIYVLGTETDFITVRKAGLFGGKEDKIKKTNFTVKKFDTNNYDETYVYDEKEILLDAKVAIDNKNDRLYLIGLVGISVKKTTGSTSITKIEIDSETMEELENVNEEFSKEVIAGLYSKEGNLSDKGDKPVKRREKRAAARVERSFKDYLDNKMAAINTIRLVTIGNNGNVYVTLEEFRIRVVTTTTRNSDGSTTTTTTYYYHYDDLIIMKFDGSDDYEVNQNFVKKANVSVNFPSDFAIGIAQNDQFIVVAQETIVACNDDLSKITKKSIAEMVDVKSLRGKLALVADNFVVDTDKIISVVNSKKNTNIIKTEFY